MKIMLKLFPIILLLASVCEPLALKAEQTNSVPISVVVRYDSGKPKYEVDSKLIRSDKILEVLGELKKQRGGRDATVVVIVDHRNSLASLSNARGIVDKAGFFNVRYYCFNPDTDRMSEVTFDHPAIPFSLNPPK